MARSHPDYPRRGSHFAHRAVRLLFKSCAAAEIGLGGVALICHIAHTEDSARYVGPVRFWNSQLCNVLAIGEDTLKRARDKCVASGWLNYERPTNRSIGYYWVTIPPELATLDDGEIEPTNEVNEMIDQQTTPREYPQDPGNGAGNDNGMPAKYGESSGECPGNGAGTSIPIPNPKEEGVSSLETEVKKPAKGETSKAKPKAPDFDPMTMDLPFDSDAFREAWSDWIEHRKAINLPLTALAAKRQLNRCKSMGEEVSLRQIDKSITSGKWPDIYPPDGRQAPAAPPLADTSTEGIMRVATEQRGIKWLE